MSFDEISITETCDSVKAQAVLDHQEPVKTDWQVTYTVETLRTVERTETVYFRVKYFTTAANARAFTKLVNEAGGEHTGVKKAKA